MKFLQAIDEEGNRKTIWTAEGGLQLPDAAVRAVPASATVEVEQTVAESVRPDWRPAAYRLAVLVLLVANLVAEILK